MPTSHLQTKGFTTKSTQDYNYVFVATYIDLFHIHGEKSISRASRRVTMRGKIFSTESSATACIVRGVGVDPYDE